MYPIPTINQTTILAHLATDSKLRPLLDEFPFPERAVSPNGIFTDLLRSITSQQLSTKAAATIYKRFAALFPNDQPKAELLLALPAQDLRAVGLSQQKIGYVQNVATFFTENNLSDLDVHSLTDAEIIQKMTQIKGVGTWTVEMLLMFSLNRPDVLPVDDLGIQQGMQRLYAIPLQAKALRQEMEKIAAPWRPYRSYACYYLWRYYERTTVQQRTGK